MTPRTAASKVDSLRELEHEMGIVVRRLKRVIGERARMVHPDLSALSYSMLSALQRDGSMRASALVDAFAIDKGAVSRHVQHLEDLGLVQRVPDPEDRRAALLSITERGLERMRQVSAARREGLLDRFQTWTDEEVESFVAELRRYNQTIDP